MKMGLKELLFGGIHGAKREASAFPGSVQDWLNIRTITGGVVVTGDGRFVKILEVLPVNVYLKSEADRRTIIEAFAAYLKIAPAHMQIQIRTVPANTAAYVERMRAYAEDEPNDACRAMIEDNIEEIGKGIAGRAICHRFFLIFQYEPHMRATGRSVGHIVDCLREEADTARRYLDGCELEVVEPRYADNFVLELLYEILNKHSGRRLPLPEGAFDMVTTVHGIYEEG